ncbi:MAG: hypothetical protein M3545_17690 [Acidobacteriota bacterium]|nr:hypothetical protein [Acidobacteriota bacterium]
MNGFDVAAILVAAAAVFGYVNHRAIGLAAAWPTARIFESLLFGLRATDTGVCVTAAVVVLVAGLAAAFVPARHAARVDPMIALRRG